MADFTSLFDRLRKTNDATILPKLVAMGFPKADCQQDLSPPEAATAGIPTLDPDVSRKPTPMLRARYAFAGSWTNASAGQEWLSLADMAKIPRDKKVMKHIRSHRDHWEGSAPAQFEFDRLSLFALSRDNPESHMYLVWPEQEKGEPELWTYSGQSERKFKDLKAYVESILTKYEKA